MQMFRQTESAADALKRSFFFYNAFVDGRYFLLYGEYLTGDSETSARRRIMRDFIAPMAQMESIAAACKPIGR